MEPFMCPSETKDDVDLFLAKYPKAINSLELIRQKAAEKLRNSFAIHVHIEEDNLVVGILPYVNIRRFRWKKADKIRQQLLQWWEQQPNHNHVIIRLILTPQHTCTTYTLPSPENINNRVRHAIEHKQQRIQQALNEINEILNHLPPCHCNTPSEHTHQQISITLCNHCKGLVKNQPD